MRTGQPGRRYGRNHGNNPNRHRQPIPHRSQSFESNGPNVKIRGTPHQIFERYVALAREGLMVENYRARWNLPREHALTAPAYSERRSRLAKQLVLGRGGRISDADTPAPEPAVAAKP